MITDKYNIHGIRNHIGLQTHTTNTIHTQTQTITSKYNMHTLHEITGAYKHIQHTHFTRTQWLIKKTFPLHTQVQRPTNTYTTTHSSADPYKQKQ